MRPGHQQRQFVKQIRLNYRPGRIVVENVSPPALRSAGVLVRTRNSTVSAGTADIARALRHMGTCGIDGCDVSNVATGRGTPVAELVELVSEVVRRPITIVSEQARRRKVERPFLVPDTSKIQSNAGVDPGGDTRGWSRPSPGRSSNSEGQQAMMSPTPDAIADSSA